MNKEELTNRIKSAIIVLKDGYPFNVGELTFGSQGTTHFSVTGWTIRNDLNNITRETALTELTETKELFKKMITTSSELSDFVVNRQIKFSLCFDYGMGGIEICSEINGQIKWTTELKK